MDWDFALIPHVMTIDSFRPVVDIRCRCYTIAMIGKRVWIVAAGFASIGTTSSNQIETSVCAIVHNPSAYDGKVVRFRAAVQTDWQHGILLFSKECHAGIDMTSIDVSRTAKAAFDRAVGTPSDGGIRRTAIADFTGRVVWKPNNWRGFYFRPATFEASGVTQIEIHQNFRP